LKDAAELQLKQVHVVRLETRPPNIEGKGAVRQRELVINSLRMRPDRIVVGEVRGEEALDMLQAMKYRSRGSLTTVHANTPRDALGRVETMVSMANLNIPERAVRQQLASAIQAVIQIARLSDGTRKVVSVSEISGMEGETLSMQEIFKFERQGISDTGQVRGTFKATGIRPKFAERLSSAVAGCVRACLRPRPWCRRNYVAADRCDLLYRCIGHVRAGNDVGPAKFAIPGHSRTLDRSQPCRVAWRDGRTAPPA